jgi:carboxypeptidase C (cathepsin A)
MAGDDSKTGDDLSAYERKLPAESAVTTEHEVEIGGSAVPYKATAGTQPVRHLCTHHTTHITRRSWFWRNAQVWDADGKVIASLFYTYYERSDVDDKTSRPLALSFNGGPGSASLWMHIA